MHVFPRFICILLATLCAHAGTGLAADGYPAKPIRLIVPFSPGGPADVLARVVGDKIGASMGKPVTVDNRPGAGGNIGMERGAKAAPDGYTLVLAPAGNLTVNPSLYRSVPYDVARDFAPVTVVAAVPNILVVHPSIPARNVGELIEYAKSHPGQRMVTWRSCNGARAAHRGHTPYLAPQLAGGVTAPRSRDTTDHMRGRIGSTCRRGRGTESGRPLTSRTASTAVREMTRYQAPRRSVQFVRARTLAHCCS